MPKKKKVEKKDESILDELAASLKKKLAEENEHEKESELEKDAEINLNNVEFDNFMLSSSGFSAPVLERMALSEPGPIFVGGIPQGPAATGGNGKESDPFKYVPGNGDANEPKYIDSDSHITAKTEVVDFSRVGRNFEPMTREATFMQSAEARFESQFQERMWNAERTDFDRERKKDFKEREETKYDKYKPDLPKSR